MNLKNLFWLLFTFFTSLHLQAQETGFPVIRNYTPNEYNSGPSVTTGIQDKRGVMYFGATSLVEYDGVTWKKVLNANMLRVYGFNKFKNNRVYVSAAEDIGYLNVTKNGSTEYVSIKSLIKDKSVKLGSFGTVKSTSKYVYFNRLNYIIQHNPKTKETIVLKASPTDTYGITFIYKDIYYFKSNIYGVLKIKNNKIGLTPDFSFFKKLKVYNVSFSNDSSGVLISTMDQGLYYTNFSKDSLVKKISIPSTDTLANVLKYRTMLVDGKYWFLGSYQNGAVLIDKNAKLLQTYKEDNALQMNSVINSQKDNTHNVWFMLNDGISKTEHSQDLSFWNKETGLKNTVTGIIRFKNTMYVATLHCVYYIDKNNKIQTVNGIPLGNAWCFLEPTTSKSLLVSTESGIYEINGNRASLIYSGYQSFILYQSKRNPQRIFSTNTGKLISLLYVNNKWIVEGSWDGVNDEIRSMIEAKNGDLWLYTFVNGVMRVTPDLNNITKPKKIKYYKEKDGLNELVCNNPFEYQNQILLGTPVGLKIYNSLKDKFEPYHKLGEKFCNGSTEVTFFQEMSDGKIFIIPMDNKKADVGLLWSNKKGGYNWYYAPFRRLPFMNIECFYAESSNVAWFGSNEGLFRYDFSKDLKNYDQKFNCLIREISCGTDSLLQINDFESNANIKLDYKFNSLKFEYAAPFFDHEERTLYSYKLDGFDNRWSDWGRQTEKEYTNLNEGEYVFKVRAKNMYDKVSDVAVYKFTVIPPFYRTWWAYLIYSILIIYIIFIIVKINLLRLRNEKKHLEVVITQRTAEITQQKNEIEHQNNKLREMDDFKQGLTSMIVHDLKNPLNLILNIPTSFKPEKQIETVKYSAKQMLNMVLNILDINKYEDSKFELELASKQFIIIVENVIVQVKFLLEQKDISLNNLIDENLVVRVDEEITERILVNLLTNAIKYSPTGGTITLATNQLSEDRVNILVTDTGEGIAADKLHLVFQKFGQVVPKKSGSVRSSGLGLTFCKMAVEAQGGEIGLASEVGKGTTFWFSLQIAEWAATFQSIEIENTNISTKIEFTKEEREVLKPAIEKLMEFSIYETDDIEYLLEELEQFETENIKLWISKINNCIKTLNQNKYQNLLTLN